MMYPLTDDLSIFVDTQFSDARASQVARNLVIEDIMARK
jgi:hypothetical protein